jgi:hypothetical protein
MDPEPEEDPEEIFAILVGRHVYRLVNPLYDPANLTEIMV